MCKIKLYNNCIEHNTMIPALMRFRREVRELQSSQPELHIKTISKQTNKLHLKFVILLFQGFPQVT